MSEQTTGKYGEPWQHGRRSLHVIRTSYDVILGDLRWQEHTTRTIACVNACDGLTDEQLASGVVPLAEVETAVQAAMSDLFTLGWDVLDRDVIAGAMGAVLERLREGR